MLHVVIIEETEFYYNERHIEVLVKFFQSLKRVIISGNVLYLLPMVVATAGAQRVNRVAVLFIALCCWCF